LLCGGACRFFFLFWLGAFADVLLVAFAVEVRIQLLVFNRVLNEFLNIGNIEIDLSSFVLFSL
jgi:TM2 domain-containing membrane protein YozV